MSDRTRCISYDGSGHNPFGRADGFLEGFFYHRDRVFALVFVFGCIEVVDCRIQFVQSGVHGTGCVVESRRGVRIFGLRVKSFKKCVSIGMSLLKRLKFAFGYFLDG